MEFFKKSEPKTEEDEKSPLWGTELGKAIADARSRGFGRKKSAKTNTTDSEGEATRDSVSTATKEQVAKLFKPEAWRAIVRAPFALGQTMTGRKCWELDSAQEDTLATSTSLTAEYFLNTDPKWVALTLFAFNWSVVLTEKFAANAVERQKEEALNPQKKTGPVGVVQ